MHEIIKMIFANAPEEEVTKAILENNKEEEMINLLVNLNRLNLNRKPHIKKYNKLRKLHSEILDSMDDYINKGSYNIEDNFNLIKDDLTEDFKLDGSNIDDKTILIKLTVYKNHPKLTSLTEIYLQKNKFKNEEKIKMLKSMNNSYVGLFKVISADKENGYVYFEDVFTKKKFKIIDISLSSSYNKNTNIYFYNRIITYDDISFATGIHCMMEGSHKGLQKFIKNHNYKNTTDFSRCIEIYNLSKKDNILKVKYNNKY